MEIHLVYLLLQACQDLVAFTFCLSMLAFNRFLLSDFVVLDLCVPSRNDPQVNDVRHARLLQHCNIDQSWKP